MRLRRIALLCVAAAAALSAIPSGVSFAQKASVRVPAMPAPTIRAPSFHAPTPGFHTYTPQSYGGNGGHYGGPPQGPGPRFVRRGPSGVPAANERRMVPDEVVIEVSNSISPQAINALEQRHRLTRIESQNFQLTGTTLFRWRIPDRRSVAAVVRALEGDATVASAQPNYLFRMQQGTAKAAPEGDAAQYELAKLHLPEAHGLAKGGNVTVAVIDSGIDANHPELAGAVVASFDAIGKNFKPHRHGTGIASLIAGHARLMGSAPAARILAARAFDPDGSSDGTTFDILKSIDWSAANGARVINMSFAGPADNAIHRALDAAHKKGIVLVAAAGNAGPKSPPLFPASDPNVIAVAATDASDRLFAQSNRGRHIAIAAPGVDILVAIPDGSYEVSSGTSYSAAEVSGIIALMIERNPALTPDAARAQLQATAKDLGPKGRDDQFGAGLADAYRAVTSEDAQIARGNNGPKLMSTGAGAR